MADAQHNLKKIAAKKATLFSKGNIEYYVCTDCGKLYADRQGTGAIDASSVIIPKVSILSLLRSLFFK